MNWPVARPIIAYLALVLLPAGWLAFFAFGTADREYAEKLEAHRARLEAESQALARRLEASISDAHRHAENVFCGAEDILSVEGTPWTGEVIGFAEGGRWMGFAPSRETLFASPRAERDREILAALDETGELREREGREPAAALKVYEGFLDEVDHPVLAARVRLRAAEAAIAAGEKTRGEEHLRALLEADSALDVDGRPVDLLASLRLLDLDPDSPTRRQVAKQTLHRQQSLLSTELLEALARRLASEDLQFTEAILARRQLERSVPDHPEILEGRDAMLAAGGILLSRPLIFTQGRRSPRAIYHVPLELPSLELGGEFRARLAPGDDGAPPPDLPVAAPAVDSLIETPVRLREKGLTVARLFLWDPRYESRLAEFASARNRHRLLIGLLVVLSLGGGLALVVYVVKERRLASLRERLLANVSHELKTPVTSIRMFSEMLAEDPLDEARTRRFGGLLLAESLRLSRIITNLLDSSWYKSREARLPLEPVDLEAALDRIADAFSHHARDRGARLVWSGEVEGWPPGSPCVISTNEGALERVLVNFLDNALKYGRPESPLVEIRARREGDAVRISVRDNGRGIQPADQDRIFEEFYRVDYEDYATKGAGLGLAICRLLATRMGGEIRLESRLEEGSEFSLVLPASPGEVGARSASGELEEVES